jgi:hypothetical protein
MRDAIVQTSAMRAFGRHLREFHAIPSEPHAGIIAVLSYAPGCGVTTAMTQYSAVSGVPLFTPRPCASDRAFLNALHQSVIGWSGDTYHGVEPIFTNIVTEFATMPDPTLIVEEPENMTPRHLALFRNLADSGRVRLIVCSRGPLFQGLAAPKTSELACLASRTRVRVELPAPSSPDVKLLADGLCECRFADDVLAEIFSRTGSSIRAIVGELESIERGALPVGIQDIDLQAWSKLTAVKTDTARALPAPPVRKAITSIASVRRVA